MISNEIKSLPISERMHLMEEIWDSLCHESVPVESPAWHQDILKARTERLHSGQAKLLTLQELKDSNRWPPDKYWYLKMLRRIYKEASSFKKQIRSVLVSIFSIVWLPISSRWICMPEFMVNNSVFIGCWRSVFRMQFIMTLPMSLLSWLPSSI